MQPVFAGKIDIIIDLAPLRTPRVLPAEVPTNKGNYSLCLYNVSKVAEGLSMEYDETTHQFRITGLTTETCKEEFPSTIAYYYYFPTTEDEQKNENTPFLNFNRNRYVFTFSVDLSKIKTEDSAIEANLKFYTYTDNCGNTFPAAPAKNFKKYSEMPRRTQGFLT